MRWYGLLSLLSDGRVKFLLWFVVVAVVVAGILTYIEIRIKKKKEKRVARVVEESIVGKMKRFLKHDKTPREKLDIVDNSAKVYFKEIYGTPANSGYSTLIEEFEKHNRKNEVAFCKAMFTAYYSQKGLTDDKAVALGDLLINIERKKKRYDDISRVPGFMEKVDRFFNRRIDTALKRKKVLKEKKNSRKLEKKRIVERSGSLKIIKRREKVFHKRKKLEAKVAKKRNKVISKQEKKRQRGLVKQSVIHKKLIAKKNRELITARREHRLKIEKEARIKKKIDARNRKKRARLKKIF